jgi:glutamyl/glutaminyl-tRNA synthetase
MHNNNIDNDNSTNNDNNIRVRFAPSPTGHLHIGGLRTALFNYLFAKKNNGKLILRIDDTDIARSKKEYEDSIISDIKWFDIKYDEFYRQSERKDIYEKYLKTLEEKGCIYECFCTEEELLRSKELSINLKKPYIYNGRCLHLNNSEKENLRKKLADAGLSPSRRLNIMKLGLEQVEFEDIVHGRVAFHVKLLGDFVLKTSDNRFTYNFASIIDDIDLGISHIIRGEDHISNTPRQILLCKALGKSNPVFAHISLLYGKDGKLMSKRDFNANLEYYKKEGYLPQAILNYLAITGNTFVVHNNSNEIHNNNNTDFNQTIQPIIDDNNENNGIHNDENLLDKDKVKDKEIFSSINEMAQYFDIKRTKNSGAIFSEDKLKFVNEKWLQHLNAETLISIIKEKFMLTGYIYLSDIDSNNNIDVQNKNANISDVIDCTEKEYGKEGLILIIDFLKNEYKTVKEIILELNNVFLNKDINANININDWDNKKYDNANNTNFISFDREILNLLYKNINEIGGSNNININTEENGNEFCSEINRYSDSRNVNNNVNNKEAINKNFLNFNETAVKNVIQKISKENKKNIKDIYENFRMVLTGKTNGPSIIKIASLLGKERVLKKLNNIVNRDI